MKIRFILAAIGLFLCASGLLADGVTVTTSSPGWVQTASNTFVLPANLAGIGCGSENFTTCEPQGQFNFNVSFATSGTVNILDPNNSESDVIHFFNSNGHGVVTFSSDPLSEPLSGPTLCVEGVGTGCTATFNVPATNGTLLNLTLASDEAASFDPLKAGFDTSDGFKVSVPESGSLALLTWGLVGLAGILRKRLPSR